MSWRRENDEGRRGNWGRRRWLGAALGTAATLALGAAGKLAGMVVRPVAGRPLRIRPFRARDLDRPHPWAG